MDDPWGSPWTATDYAPPKIDLPAPPPSAHFSTSADHSPQQRVSPARTPWEDDDAWGGWNEPAKDSNSPRWGRSPGLRPQDANVNTNSSGGGSGPASRLPSPSPDAWGQLAMLETARMRKDERNVDSAISLGEGTRRDGEKERYLGSMTHASGTKDTVEDIWRRPDAEASAASSSTPASEEAPRPGSPEQPPGPAIHLHARPKMSRQPSLKVQELVSMYDGITKRNRSVSPMDPSLRKTSSTASPIELQIPEPRGHEPRPLDLGPVEEPLKDTGHELEVKEVVPVDAPLAVEAPPPVKESPPVVALPRFEPPLDVQTNTDDDLKNEETPNQVPVIQTVLPETRQEPLPKRLESPSEPYSIDLSKLDDLFPSVDTSFPSPEPVPDVIIDDTFASIDERKTWYRLSRFGSIRKHALGDDENYVRISWGASTVRHQAIQIVRRWMEEDSIAGRVVLGRRTGAAGSKIFNWDSSAPQVEIAELLSRKSHSRHASTISKTTVASPTAPAFGWSSSSPSITIPPPDAHTSPITEPSSTVKSSPVTRPPAIKPIGPPNSTIQPIASPTSPLAQPPNAAEPYGSDDDTDEKSGDDEDEEDDDDDWGEMVSSPTADSNGAFPSLAAIVDAGTEPNGFDASSPTEAAPSSDKPASSPLKKIAPAMDWANVPRSSFDAPPSHGLIPASQSKSSIMSLTDTSRFSMDIPASHGFLPISQSKSSTASWNDLTRSSLDIGLSEELIANKAMFSLKNKSRPSSWAFGNVDFRDGAPKPAKPMKDIPLATRKALALLSRPSEAPENDLPTEQSPPTSRPASPQPQSPTIDTSKDDEAVANILRDLPDLSYMLR
ncbi:hypothetical protein AK830_g2498 [Neonectria ditissima]|uniref:Uncharacterized protein n=1 Tax=Neonectria ditissima TaxID=78410 RepID=A0A0P7BEP4_9HYPO|nr:hypothetical protein AK830_g2498 [Neonectria ditissima]